MARAVARATTEYWELCPMGSRGKPLDVRGQGSSPPESENNMETMYAICLRYKICFCLLLFGSIANICCIWSFSSKIWLIGTLWSVPLTLGLRRGRTPPPCIFSTPFYSHAVYSETFPYTSRQFISIFWCENLGKTLLLRESVYQKVKCLGG